MTKLKYYGYKEETITLRRLTFAELQLLIIDAYVNKGEKEVEIINATSGDIEIFNTIKDVLSCNWDGNAEIEIVNMPHVYGTDTNYKTIIIFKEA